MRPDRFLLGYARTGTRMYGLFNWDVDPMTASQTRAEIKNMETEENQVYELVPVELPAQKRKVKK